GVWGVRAEREGDGGGGVAGGRAAARVGEGRQAAPRPQPAVADLAEEQAVLVRECHAVFRLECEQFGLAQRGVWVEWAPEVRLAAKVKCGVERDDLGRDPGDLGLDASQGELPLPADQSVAVRVPQRLLAGLQRGPATVLGAEFVQCAGDP